MIPLLRDLYHAGAASAARIVLDPPSAWAQADWIAISLLLLLAAWVMRPHSRIR